MSRVRRMILIVRSRCRNHHLGIQRRANLRDGNCGRRRRGFRSSWVFPTEMRVQRTHNEGVRADLTDEVPAERLASGLAPRRVADLAPQVRRCSLNWVAGEIDSVSIEHRGNGRGRCRKRQRGKCGNAECAEDRNSGNSEGFTARTLYLNNHEKCSI